jgi:hypothetical protein
MAYRFYVSDTLQIIAKNGAKQSGGDYFDKRYCDIVSTPKVNTRNAAEMVADVISRAGIKVI